MLNDDGYDDRTLVLSLLATEEMLEAEGWDALPRVLSLMRPDDAPEFDRDGVGEGAELLAWLVVGEGDPYDLLAGFDGRDSLGLVTAAEAWSWPPDLPEEQRVGRPSDHPDRIELRSVIAVMRNGDVMMVTRPRGGEPIVEFEGGGPLVDAMYAALTGGE